jgi:DNA invertase Pin-like site-specific DNA recombinase
MSNLAYCRISDSSQCEDRQVIEMQKLNIPDSHIYIDKISGVNFDRPKYKKLMNRLKSGDTLFLSSIDRLGRDYNEIQDQYRIITKEKGVDVVILDMPLLDTRLHRDLMGTFIADLTLQILSFVSHSERDSIKKRQAAGIAAARVRGVHMGRPVKRPPDNFMVLAKQWKRGKISISELKEMTGFKESTLYRRLRECNISRNK